MPKKNKQKNIRLNFLVTEQEKKLLFEIADEKGFHTFSDFCRIILLHSKDLDINLTNNSNIENVTMTITGRDE